MCKLEKVMREKEEGVSRRRKMREREKKETRKRRGGRIEEMLAHVSLWPSHNEKIKMELFIVLNRRECV